MLPPLHVKLGLRKNFVQELDKNGPALSFLCKKFPKLSMEKIKVDAFIDLGICQLLINTQFDLSHSDDEKAA